MLFNALLQLPHLLAGIGRSGLSQRFFSRVTINYHLHSVARECLQLLSLDAAAGEFRIAFSVLRWAMRESSASLNTIGRCREPEQLLAFALLQTKARRAASSGA